MSMNDPLANVLSAIKNAEKAGKPELSLSPASKIIKAVLTTLKKEDYISDFKFSANKKGGMVEIKLAGNINKIGVIKPKFSVKISDFEKFEKRYLPAKDFGRLIISTPKGMMTHIEAKEKKQGGILIAYVY